MISHILLIDTLRKDVENSETRVSVDKITILSDGDYRVIGAIIRRATRFNRTWIINQHTH